MKRKLSLPVVFIFYISNLFSQIDLQVGPVLPHEKGVHLYKVLGTKENEVYSLWVDSRGKNGNDEFYLESHDLNTLTKKFSVLVPFSQEKGKYDVMESAFLGIDKIVFLTSKHLTHQKMLYAQVFDLKGKVIRPVFQFDYIDVKTPNNAHFYCSYGRDTDIIIVRKTASEDGERANSVSIYKASDLSRIWQNDFPSSVFKVNEDAMFDFGMKSTGEVFYLSASTDFTQGKNTKTNFSFVIKHPKEKEKSVSLMEDGESFLGAILFYLPQKNIFIVGGFKEKDNKSYSFLYSIDMECKIINKKNAEIVLSDEKRFVWTTKKGPDKVRFIMQYRSMLGSGNDVWIVGEQQAAATNGDVGVYYFYNDLIAVHFNLENDNHSWNNFEKRERVLTRRENAGSACFMYLKNSDLNILYMDSKENLAKLNTPGYNVEDLEKVVEHNNSTLVVGKIDKDNKVSRQTCNSEAAMDFHLKCRVVPDASDPRGHNYLCYRLEDESLLVFLEDNNVGRWAIAKNVK